MLQSPEEFLMLELFVAEADQRFERHLIAKPVIAADLQDLGVDEPFDQAEDVGIGPPWIRLK
jgi:hypothetical protein